MQKNLKKGFTLIELLVVIAIIGILSSVVIVSLNNARSKARDSSRKSNMQALVTALALHSSEISPEKPAISTTVATECPAGWNTTNIVTGVSCPDLDTNPSGTPATSNTLNKYVSALPNDGAPNTYYYCNGVLAAYSAGDSDASFALLARMENDWAGDVGVDDLTFKCDSGGCRDAIGTIPTDITFAACNLLEL